MSKRGNIEFLSDIKEAIGRIELYIEKMSYQEFLQDRKSQDAVVRNLEIIGEATKNIPNDFKKKYPRIQWKKLAAVRDRLIHYYFGVNYDIVWGIVKEELPTVIRQIEEILHRETKEEDMRFNNKKGVSLIIVVFAMMLLGVLGWSLAVLQSTDFESSLRQVDSERALYLAEAGAQWALSELDTSFCCHSGTHRLDFGEYSVSSVCADVTQNCDCSTSEPTWTCTDIIVTSTGYVPDIPPNHRAMREVEVGVSQGAFSRAGTVGNLFEWYRIHSGSEIIGDLAAGNFNGDGDEDHNEPCADYGVAADCSGQQFPPGEGGREVSGAELPAIPMDYYRGWAQSNGNYRDYSATAEVSSDSSKEDLKLVGAGIFNEIDDDEPEAVRRTDDECSGQDWAEKEDCWVVIKEGSGYQNPSWVKVYLKVGEEEGEELVTNGTFYGSTTGWTLGSGWSYEADEEAVRHSSDGTAPLSQNLSITAGKTYKLTYSITDCSDCNPGKNVTPSLGGQTGTSKYAVGTYTEIFTVTTTAGLAFTPKNTVRCTIDDVSVREIEILDMSNWIGKTVRVIKRFAGAHNNEALWYIEGSDILIDARTASQGTEDEVGDNIIDKEAKFEKTSLVAEGDIIIIGSKPVTMKAHIEQPPAKETFPNLATRDGNIISVYVPEGGTETKKSNNRSFDGLIYTQTGDIRFNYIDGVAIIGYNVFLDGLIKLKYDGRYVSSERYVGNLSTVNWRER